MTNPITQESYAHRVIVALDVFANVLTGGKPDETISSRSARAAANGNWLGKFMIAWLNLIQKNHGTLAEQADLQRAQAIEQTENSALKNQ